MPKTFRVVGGDTLIERMFHKRGWEKKDNPDLLVFSGGEDVTPMLYGEGAHPKTYYSEKRDKEESWEYLTNRNKYKVGICRGGQFLNVMNGGRMFQHVDNHGGSHWITDHDTGEKVFVTSTHHQMMRPAGGKIVCTANLCTQAETDKGPWPDWQEGHDYEVVYYSNTFSLCFQPHPEYELKSCEDYFFKLLAKYYGFK